MASRVWWLVVVALFVGAPLRLSRAEDQAPAPLTVIIEDGEVLFQGADLDLDQLKSRLAATGRQKERILFRIGPNAKTVYVKQVIDAIKEAGFADIGMMPPPGLEKAVEPPV